MMTFAIGTLSGDHAGFLLMMADNDANNTGSLMLKVQIADAKAAHLPEIHALVQFPQGYLGWSRENDMVQICDESGEEVAQLQREYLRFRGYLYRLNDLTGVC